MSRYVRNSAVLAKIESTYGTDSVPTGADNAILVSNLSANPLNAQNVDRSLLRNYFGASEQLVGSAYKMVEFDVEFQNGGTAGTAAKWDVLLQMCGFAAGDPLLTPSRVEHDIAAPGAQGSGTIYYFDDGVRHILLGAKGGVSFNIGVGERPVMRFSFIGLDGDETAQSMPTTTLTGFKAPLAVTDPNTGALTLGCTYSAGALSGGTEYVSGGISIDLGNAVQFIDLLGTASLPGQKVEITDRVTTARAQLELTAAAEVTLMGTIRTNTTTALGLVHGTTAGYKMLVYAPAVQMVNPRLEDRNGRRMLGVDLRFLPSAGNDELMLVAL